MNLIAQSEITAADVNFDSLDSNFRRASVNMVMATLNCEAILKFLPKDVSKNEISFVLATHFGEVTTTLEFLSTFYETNVPRPILFQNSLHNSTLGFVSIHLGITGPSMTVSCDHETAASAQAVCESMLGITPCTLLCFVDSIPAALSKQYVDTYPFLEKYLNKSICFLYGRD